MQFLEILFFLKGLVTQWDELEQNCFYSWSWNKLVSRNQTAGWMTEESWFDSGTGKIFFSYSKCSYSKCPYSPWDHPCLTLPHVQWVLGTCVLCVKQLVYEAGHFHVVLRLRNAWSLYSTLPCAYILW